MPFAPLEPTVTVLFRYRDMIAETLEEHRKLIAAHGACWWGWWKRPAEDGRADIWEPLAKSVAERQHVHVGLFDSGAHLDVARAAWRARVIDLRPPQRDEKTNLWSSPPLPEDEAHLVPEYYRKSPFSRGWLKMDLIEEAPIELFRMYSFASPPPLRGIPDRYLQRLEGKLLLDSDELRAMDTTVWHVVADAAGRDERFLAPSIHVVEPVTSTPIPVDGAEILHLTDLHFATKQRGEHVWGYLGEQSSGHPPLAEMVGSALKGRSIGVVVITGDLTFQALRTEYEEAKRSIGQLLGSLGGGLGFDNVVVVPGNHDIAWTKDENDEYDPEKDGEVNAASADARAEFEAFYSGLLRHSPDRDLCMARRYVLPSGRTVDVCALNSMSLETGEKFLNGMGRVAPSAFARLRGEMGWDTVQGSPTLRILALHHHLTATEDVESPDEYYKGFGMAIDAKKTLREAARSGTHLILHGHRHRTFFWRSQVCELPEYTKKEWVLGHVSILGGGSVGSTAVFDKSNYFNVLAIEKNELKVDLYKSKDRGPFEVFQTWVAQLGQRSDGSLDVHEWARPQ